MVPHFQKGGKRGRPKKNGNELPKNGKVPKGSEKRAVPPKPPRAKNQKVDDIICSGSTQSSLPGNYSAVVVPVAAAIQSATGMATPTQPVSTQLVTSNLPADPLEGGENFLKSYFKLKRVEQLESHTTRLELLEQDSKEKAKTAAVKSTVQAAFRTLDASEQDHRRAEQVLKSKSCYHIHCKFTFFFTFFIVKRCSS